MRARYVCVVIATALLVVSTGATAQQSAGPDYARPGFYLGIGVEGASYTELSDSLEREAGVPSVDTDIPVGFNIYGGYRVHPNIAVEAEFEMMPSSDVKAMGIKIAEVQTWSFTGNVKLLPMTGQFQPFALVGIGVLGAELKVPPFPPITTSEVKESEAGFAARFGGGVDFYVTENIAVSARITYVLPTGSSSTLPVEEFDYESFGGGLQYRF